MKGLWVKGQHLELGLQLLPRRQGKLESKRVDGTQDFLTTGSDNIPAWGGSSRMVLGLLFKL